MPIKEQSTVVIYNSLLFRVAIQLRYRLEFGFQNARVVGISKQLLWWVVDFLSQPRPESAQSDQPSVESPPTGTVSAGAEGHERTVLQSSVLFRLATRQAASDSVVINLRDARLIGPIIIFIEQSANRLVAQSDTIPTTATVFRFGYQTWSKFFRHPIRTVSFGLIPIVLCLLLWQVLTSTTFGLGSLGLLVLLLLSVLGTQKKESWDGVKSYRSAADEPRATVQSWVNNSFLLRPFDSYRLVFLFASGYLVVGLSRVLSLGSYATIELFSFVILAVGLVVVFWSYTEPPTDM